MLVTITSIAGLVVECSAVACPPVPALAVVVPVAVLASLAPRLLFGVVVVEISCLCCSLVLVWVSCLLTFVISCVSVCVCG